MFSKSFALVAAFAAFLPAFASPTPNALAPVELNFERSLVGVGVVVDNILNNATISVLSTRNVYGCSASEVRAVVTTVARNADPESLSVRGTCDVAAVSSEAASAIEELYFKALGAPSKRGVGCTAAEVTAAVYNVANNMNIKVLSPKTKRGGCDQVKLDTVVKDTLNDMDVTVLSTREEYSLSSFIESL